MGRDPVNGVPFVVNILATDPNYGYNVECRLVDDATLESASWTEPYGFEGYIWDQTGLVEPDYANTVLDGSNPVLDCDVDGEGLVTLDGFYLGGVFVVYDWYANTATVTGDGAYGPDDQATEDDVSYFVNVNCAVDPRCYVYAPTPAP